MIVRVNADRAYLWCPGCEEMHGVTFGVGEGVRWTFDGNLERPTISPSILVRYRFGHEDHDRVCHSFVRGGQWQFLGDSTHDLAGQTVDCVPIPRTDGSG